jgi:hypothetical protein
MSQNIEANYKEKKAHLLLSAGSRENLPLEKRAFSDRLFMPFF